MPHVIGATNDKHLRIRNPDLGGPYYFNYLNFFFPWRYLQLLMHHTSSSTSTSVLLGQSDGGAFAQTRLAEMLRNQDASLPLAEALPNASEGPTVDYYLTGDDAFPLHNYLMKPYPLRGLSKEERIYNYRLSRARRTAENAFGIMTSRFRVFHTSICLNPTNIEAVMLASCVLHNILRGQNPPGRRQMWRTPSPMTLYLAPGEKTHP